LREEGLALALATPVPREAEAEEHILKPLAERLECSLEHLRREFGRRRDQLDHHGDAYEGEKPARGPIEAAQGIKADSYLTGAQFDAKQYRRDFLIERVLVADQPAAWGGPQKSMKTTICVDASISLGTGTSFLGYFRVPNPVPSLLVSCESGEATIHETARRICRAKGVKLSDSNTFWHFDPYQLASPVDLARLKVSLKTYKPSVVIFDPLYLMLLAGDGARGMEAGNMFVIGPLLMNLARCCADAGAIRERIGWGAERVSRALNLLLDEGVIEEVPVVTKSGKNNTTERKDTGYRRRASE